MSAIQNKVQIRFLYGWREVVLDPYFILFEEDGTKAIYGMSSDSGSLCKFSFRKMLNIKLLSMHFNPVVPVSPSYN